MDGKQQAPPQAQDAKKAPCMCGENDLQEPNGCAECRCQNRPYVVQVSILQELPPNKRKRNKAIGKLVEVVRFAFIVVLAFMAISANDSIDTGNVFLDLAVIISIYCFVCYGLCMAVFRLIDKILDV